jgi:hypothetical protein
MSRQINIAENLSSSLAMGYDGHIYSKEGGKLKDMGRLFESLPRIRAKIDLSLVSKRINPKSLDNLSLTQRIIEAETTYVTKIIDIKIEALATYLERYSRASNGPYPSGCLNSNCIPKDLRGLHQLPKIKPLCKRLEILGQQISEGSIEKNLAKQKLRQIIGELQHSVHL